MNYQNFKRHSYLINWLSIRGKDPLDIIKLHVFATRDGSWPFADEVTDIHEFKYACKVNDFDFNSLDKDETGFFIKKDSLEWNKYLKEPGVPISEYLNNNLTYIPVEEEGDYIKVPLDLFTDHINHKFDSHEQ